ncbi:MAG: RnfABCDGE type electron transport complex subunit G [Lentisphaerae bacterium]|nr:RnfABCDGE type electron transport complex subunit G [Lentisphaerota bacterium]
MKESIKLVVVLTIICTIAGALLAVVKDVTSESMQAAAQKEKNDAIKKVLPTCDNDPVADAIALDVNGIVWTFFVARDSNGFLGAAFESTSSKGYGGDIAIMVGVNANGTVQAVEVLSHKETPGLGAWISGEAFRSQFVGRSIADTSWAVAKDGGDIDQITAATISSRAVTEAVKAGLDIYTAHPKSFSHISAKGAPQ